MTPTKPVDPCRCPLCGAPNGCAMAADPASPTSGPCWCTLEKFSARLLARVPEAVRHKACICQTCALTDQGKP